MTNTTTETTPAGQWRAINNYVTLDMVDPETHMTGGLVVPGTQKQTPRWGRILTVGPGVVDYNGVMLKPDVSEGDMAYVSAHGQIRVETNATEEREQLTMASIMDILCTWKEGASIEPLGSYIWIKPYENAETTKGGLVLPGAEKRIPSTAEVLAVGKGFQTSSGVRVPFQVEVGDIIAYDPLSTLIVDLNHLGIGEKFELVMHTNVVAVLCRAKQEQE